MPFDVFVALRYLRDQRSQTILILGGIGVGVGVIIFLSALITGLQKDLVERALGSQAHVVVRPREEVPRLLPGSQSGIRIGVIERPPQRVRSIEDWQQIRARLARMPGIVGVATTVTGPAIAVRGRGSIAVTVRGIELEGYRTVVDIEPRLVAGRFDLARAHAVVGTELARKLGTGVGGRIRLQESGGRGDVYTIAGVFDYNSVTLNEGLVFVSLRDAQTLFDLEGGVSAVELKGSDIFEAEALADRARDRTGLDAQSWMSQNGDLLAGLRSQTLSSVVIQASVALAVALGIASVLAVSVVEKAGEIGILRATGTRASTITRIFLIQGLVLGTAGSLLGVGLGTGLSLLFALVAQNPDGSAAFPLALSPALYGRASLVAMGVGLFAAVVPARAAARMDPATAIRNG